MSKKFSGSVYFSHWFILAIYTFDLLDFFDILDQIFNRIASVTPRGT
jgi:hypothetical protein